MLKKKEQIMTKLAEPTRKRLPDTRPSITHKGGWRGFEFYTTVGFYDNVDDRLDPGEVFVTVAKQGSDTAIFVNGWAVMVSMALQSGVPWEKVHAKFSLSPFENLLEEVCKSIQICIDERCKTIGMDEEPEHSMPVRLAEQLAPPNPEPANEEEGSASEAPERTDWNAESKRPLFGKDGKSKMSMDDGTQVTYGDRSIWNRDMDDWAKV